MKRLLYKIWNAPLAPSIALIIGFSAMYLSKDYFFPCLSDESASAIMADLGIVVDMALAIAILGITARIGYGQIQAQRDAIKLQLFEKRYEIFRVIADSYVLITTDDITDELISGKYENMVALHKAIGKAKDDMRRITMESQCLFSEPMVQKINDANLYFANYCREYYSYLRSINLDAHQTLLFNELYLKYVATQGNERESVAAELTKRFPDIYNRLIEMNQIAIDAYKKVDESGLFVDFNDYLMISDIDK